MSVFLGGGNSHIFGFFTPKIGEDEPILTSIFFKWVETTNQFCLFFCSRSGRMMDDVFFQFQHEELK